MIVVVDTNIWISALHFSGSDGIPLRALHKAARVDTIATCEEIENEISIVLQARFKWAPDQIARSLAETLARAIHVRIHGTVKVCRDPDDNKILECAELAARPCRSNRFRRQRLAYPRRV